MIRKRGKVKARRNVSIQIKIGITIMLLTTLSLVGFGVYQYRTRKEREMARLEAFAVNVGGQLSINLADPIWNFDERQVNRVVEAEMKDQNILAILVRDASQNVFTGKTRDEEWNIIGMAESLKSEFSPILTEILRGEDRLGLIEIYMTPRFVQAELNLALRDIGVIVIVLNLLLFIMLNISIRLLLIRPLNRLLHIATMMANGNFQKEISIRQRDEIGALAEEFRNMKESMVDVVKQVQKASYEVSTGSQQLRDGAAKMSQGGAQQAASTEEVSSSMEEMMANITQNAENAQQTEKIALKAASDALEGGQAVEQAVTAMQTIAQKISIIEEIANRTHILSMNASIEAAKAQEYGKGFAVVAAEVRILAGQTQNAAKEINALATSTFELAETARDLLKRLVPDIQHTAELIQEISAASQEQRAGATQINQAMQQLDEVTQQYAATAEEIASTSEELASQAEQLQHTIDFFKLPEERMLVHTSQDSWQPLMEMIQAIPDEAARQQLLLTMGKALATPQTPDVRFLEIEQDDIAPERVKKKKNDAERSYGIDLSEDENSQGNIDDDFERY